VKTYYSIVSSCTGNMERTWWHAKFEEDNPLKKTHQDFGIVFETKDDCVVEIENKIEKYGGRYFGDYGSFKHRGNRY